MKVTSEGLSLRWEAAAWSVLRFIMKDNKELGIKLNKSWQDLKTKV